MRGDAAIFIMAPELNFSSAFSACSLQQMQPRIQAASCIVNRNRDLAVSVAAESIDVVVNEPFEYVVDVQSDRRQPRAERCADSPHGLAANSQASMPDATCSPLDGVLRCELGEIPPSKAVA